ncbi:DNA-binding protein [Actinoalloteichus sp. AHMU CJ021]|nr:DNA-binding protein [Actinoalloteichus sp. AHMU CJ021]
MFTIRHPVGNGGLWPRSFRIRTRYVVPVRAVEDLVRRAVDSGGVVDVSQVAANRRDARDFHRAGGAAW